MNIKDLIPNKIYSVTWGSTQIVGRYKGVHCSATCQHTFYDCLHYDSPMDMPGDKVRGLMAFKGGSFGGVGFDSWEKMLTFADIVVMNIEDFIKQVNENINYETES